MEAHTTSSAATATLATSDANHLNQPNLNLGPESGHGGNGGGGSDEETGTATGAMEATGSGGEVTSAEGHLAAEGVPECDDCDQVCWSECSCSCHGGDDSSTATDFESFVNMPTPQRSLQGGGDSADGRRRRRKKRHGVATADADAAATQEAGVLGAATTFGWGPGGVVNIEDADSAVSVSLRTDDEVDTCSECDEVCWSECSCECHDAAPEGDDGDAATTTVAVATLRHDVGRPASPRDARKVDKERLREALAAAATPIEVGLDAAYKATSGALAPTHRGVTFGRAGRPGLATRPAYTGTLELDVDKADRAVRKRVKGAGFGAKPHKPRLLRGAGSMTTTAAASGKTKGKGSSKGSGHGEGAQPRGGGTSSSAGGGPASPSVVDVPMAVTKPRATGGYIAPLRTAGAQKKKKKKGARAFNELMEQFRGTRVDARRWGCPGVAAVGGGGGCRA